MAHVGCSDSVGILRYCEYCSCAKYSLPRNQYDCIWQYSVFESVFFRIDTYTDTNTPPPEQYFVLIPIGISSLWSLLYRYKIYMQ